MSRIRRIFYACVLFFAGVTGMPAQQLPTTEVAGLRPNQQLLWRRISPTLQQPEGPVLYQIGLRSSATQNRIPKFGKNLTLVNSLLTDNGSQVAIGGLAINSSGVVSFANGQSFPGTLSGIRAGDGSIAIGGSASAPTVSLAANGITNANIADGAIDPYKISGIAATTGTNFFSGTQTVAGDGGSSFVGDGFFRMNANQGWLLITDVGCEPGFLGLVMVFDVNSFVCNGYALVSNGTQTAVNAPTGGFVALRINNNDGLVVEPSGNVFVPGTLSKGAGSFKIDDPRDPANKYLYHSFVESPDMKNVYDGVVMLDNNGEALVTLPEWFGALNRDFRYQLTAIGVPGPNLYIAEEISNNYFKIAGGAPGGKVSWLVTGIRQDAYANAHRIPVEEDKPGAEKGTYLHPELFGAPPEKGLSAQHGPKARAARQQ